MNISDNIIIAQEAIHSIKNKHGKACWMALKVDLEKAYDKIRWEFLEDTMVDAGFPSSLI